MCANCKFNRDHSALDRQRCHILRQEKKNSDRYKKTPEWVTRPLPNSSPVAEYLARPTSAVGEDVTDDPDNVSLPSSSSLIEDRLVDMVISMLQSDWSKRTKMRLLLDGPTLPSGVPRKLWKEFQATFTENRYVSHEGISEFVPSLDTAYDSDASFKTAVNTPEPRQSVNRIDAFGVEPSAVSSSPGSLGNLTDRKVICISDTSAPSTPASSTDSTPEPSPTVQKRKTRQSQVNRPKPSYSKRDVIVISDTSAQSTPAPSSTCPTPTSSPVQKKKKTSQPQVDRPKPSYSLRSKRSLDHDQDGHDVQHKRPRRATKADELRSIVRSDPSLSNAKRALDTTPTAMGMTLRSRPASGDAAKSVSPRPASGDTAKSVSKKRKRVSGREDTEDFLKVQEPARSTASLASRSDTDDEAKDSILAKPPVGAQRTLYAYPNQGFV
uniref:WGS project CBME000000000 data, contig CS3487_c001489 n=1 Tax=Fusarium pseudograminearum CS3487 TaxID=1318458 RepID=A0A096PDJ4_FUSPS|nr:unnamed protein product [Fusarium pseudograminearum CS3487]